MINQINSLTIKFYINLSQITNTNNASIFFRKLSQVHDFVQTHCNNLNNPFHIGIRKWIINQ